MSLDLDTTEQFSSEDVEVIIKSAVGSVLTESSHFCSQSLGAGIISAALKGLQSLNRPYKYAITVILMQKNGAGLVSAASTFWDASKDGLCKVMWENGTTHCIVTIYGTSVNIESKGDDE
jgi:dynein light chain Tctex-type 1